MIEMKKTVATGDSNIGNNPVSFRKSGNDTIDYVLELEQRVSTLEQIVRILIANSDIQ